MLWTSRNKNKAPSSSSKYPKKSHVHAPKSESCLGGIMDTNTVLKKRGCVTFFIVHFSSLRQGVDLHVPIGTWLSIVHHNVCPKYKNTPSMMGNK